KQLILVTDANIVAHVAGARSDLMVCDALTGRPIPGARVREWHNKEYNSPFVSREGQSDKNGLVSFTFDGTYGGAVFIAASAPNGRQAFITTSSYGNWIQRDAQWHIYAFTDRPAYRPGEKVQWKLIARVRQDRRWTTPANETIS